MSLLTVCYPTPFLQRLYLIVGCVWDECEWIKPRWTSLVFVFDCEFTEFRCPWCIDLVLVYFSDEEETRRESFPNAE